MVRTGRRQHAALDRQKAASNSDNVVSRSRTSTSRLHDPLRRRHAVVRIVQRGAAFHHAYGNADLNRPFDVVWDFGLGRTTSCSSTATRRIKYDSSNGGAVWTSEQTSHALPGTLVSSRGTEQRGAPRDQGPGDDCRLELARRDLDVTTPVLRRPTSRRTGPARTSRRSPSPLPRWAGTTAVKLMSFAAVAGDSS